jgi:hypothetical protein
MSGLSNLLKGSYCLNWGHSKIGSATAMILIDNRESFQDRKGRLGNTILIKALATLFSQ